jgi:hypothetical protein
MKLLDDVDAINTGVVLNNTKLKPVDAYYIDKNTKVLLESCRLPEPCQTKLAFKSSPMITPDGQIQ